MECSAAFPSCWMSWVSPWWDAQNPKAAVGGAKIWAVCDSRCSSVAQSLVKEHTVEGIAAAIALYFSWWEATLPLVYKSQLKGRGWLGVTTRKSCVQHNVLILEGISLRWLLKNGKSLNSGSFVRCLDLDRIILGHSDETGSTCGSLAPADPTWPRATIKKFPLWSSSTRELKPHRSFNSKKMVQQQCPFFFPWLKWGPRWLVQVCLQCKNICKLGEIRGPFTASVNCSHY